ncbi:SET and MYND domain-containing protein 4-like [Amphibalanus amphitrite]|uniref:SET and MYND domain-containing protein 4-like n=1 Tax=Amphibalanus amphitrite TaxID=1232801 RepID=UPI001C921C4E|nr:SET and MYND domain-containing protein 4-like [Amphibalanus amphitrite]
MITEEDFIVRFFQDAVIRGKLSSCQSAPRRKDDSLAVSHRERGNASFRSGRFAAALQQYGEAALNADSAETLSGALANRSAALHRLQRHQDSLDDIAHALESGYPADRHHKLHVRRARCLLALGRLEQSRAALAQYLSALDSLRLGPSAREKLTAEADALSADIDRAATGGGPDRCVETGEDESSTPQPALEGGNGPLAGASSCLQLRQSERKGRHVVTTRPVAKGAVLFAEEPYVCVLLPERRLDHCHHCLRHTHALLPCARCPDVGFCSAACRDAACAVYHAAECGHTAFLEAFGIGRAAVRVLLTAGWQRVRALRTQLAAVGSSCRADSCSCHRPEGDRYLAVFHLVHHLAESHTEDAYHYGRAAATLAVFLAERTAFFGADAGSAGPPDWALRWTAALLLRHILQLVCNAHAPTKLVPLPSDGDGDGGVVQLSEQRIATAIYPSASYMNHSCDPSIINSFWGNTLIVRSIKSLSAGAEVYHCYGPHYARGAPAERRRQLLEQYHFICDCEHCTRPELAHHLERLNALRCVDCGGATLPVGEASVERRCCLECRRTHCYSDRQQRLQRIEAEAEQVASAGGGSGDRQVVCRLDELLREATVLSQPSHETLYILHDLRANICTRIGDPTRALESLRPNLASAEARYGADSVELGNLLLTTTDVLVLAVREARTKETRRELSDELRRLAENGLAIFTIHYGEWSPAYRDLRRKLAEVRREQPT